MGRRYKRPVIENLEGRLFLDGGGLTAPVLQDQVMSHAQDQLVLMLPERAADGDTLSYLAAARTPAAEAYALRQSLGLTTYAAQYDNCSGRGEKWFQDSGGGWHYLVSDGRLYRWSGGLLEGQVAAAYYADPRALLNVQDNGPPPVDLAVAGNRLTIDPVAGFTGRFVVDVTAIAGAAAATGSFAVTVTNNAPVLDIADQAMSHTQDTLTLVLPATDADGDAVGYSVSVQPWGSAAYELKMRLDLTSYVSRFDNWAGRGEKWLQNRSGTWFVLETDGRLHRNDSGRVEGQVDAAYVANPQLLIDAQPADPPDVALSVAGNQLIIDPAAGYVGKFQVTVTASDGLAQMQNAFAVSVTNTAPVLALADQTVPHTQDTLTLVLPATDADGDAVTYSAAVRTGDAAAYELRQRLGLASYAAQYDNCSGRGEKWFQDSRGGWYYLMPDGGVYRLGSGALEGRVSADFCANPQSLLQAEPPQPPDVALSVIGNRLTINPAPTYAGQFLVDVTATDGVSTTGGRFSVTVTNAVPTLALADQTIPGTQDTLTLTLPAADADGDIVTYTAAVKTAREMARELRDRLGLASYASQYDNCSGRGEKWLQDAAGAWFYVLSNGSVYRNAAGQAEGVLDTAYYADPRQLFNLEAGGSTNVTVSVAGNRLTIDPAAGFSGKFSVLVTASDGIAQPVRATMNVTVLPLNDPSTYSPGSQVATRIVTLTGGLEFVVLGTDGADTLTLSQAANSVTLTTLAGASTYNGQFSTVTVYSFGGNDTLRITQSVTAAVTVHAGDGDDSVFAAGTGKATVYGDAGDDLLVTVGGGADTANGGAGLDSFWVDSSDTVADAAAAETAAASLHRITRFYQPTSDPAKAVSLEIAGQDIVDPTAGYTYRSYASGPLFTDGPEYTDIRQGAVGDCYFMASLASLAQTDPAALRQMIAPMGDGTYAVRFYSNGQANYVRVDASLPAFGSTPAYARLTPDGELWVALAEKAYAQFRYGDNSYDSLSGGWMEPVYYAVTGAATGSMYTTATGIADTMAGYLSAGHALTAASRSNPSGPAVGNHAYMIKAVETVGGQSYVTVYNPWGFDGKSWDSNSSDGLLKMDLATFRQDYFAVSYCMA
jgi:hypothetical protein